jgi:hypothetical protein
MANKPVKKNIEKAFDNSSFKNLGLSGETVKEKEVTWIPFKKAFHTNNRCSKRLCKSI